MGERRPYKPKVTGSSPVPPTKSALYIFSPHEAESIRGRSSVWLERWPVTPEVASSSLVAPATVNRSLPQVVVGFFYALLRLHPQKRDRQIQRHRQHPESTGKTQEKAIRKDQRLQGMHHHIGPFSPFQVLTPNRSRLSMLILSGIDHSCYPDSSILAPGPNPAGGIFFSAHRRPGLAGLFCIRRWRLSSPCR